jgi:hypothetical protein
VERYDGAQIKLWVFLWREWRRRASFALPAGSGSEGEARAAWRVRGSLAPGRPRWRWGAVLLLTASTAGVGA